MYTKDDLEKLEAAIAQGIQTVKYTDKEITYRSLEEMLKIREIMLKAVEKSSISEKRVQPQFSKGL